MQIYEMWSQFHQHFTFTFFVQNCFAQLFSNYTLAFKFFLQKKIGAKGVHKMLIKLTRGWNNSIKMIYCRRNGHRVGLYARLKDIVRSDVLKSVIRNN
jgi:hypothetical protein